jgi:hypothetical protein
MLNLKNIIGIERELSKNKNDNKSMVSLNNFNININHPYNKTLHISNKNMVIYIKILTKFKIKPKFHIRI